MRNPVHSKKTLASKLKRTARNRQILQTPMEWNRMPHSHIKGTWVLIKLRLGEWYQSWQL